MTFPSDLLLQLSAAAVRINICQISDTGPLPSRLPISLAAILQKETQNCVPYKLWIISVRGLMDRLK
jgi:hypothetical protein